MDTIDRSDLHPSRMSRRAFLAGATAGTLALMMAAPRAARAAAAVAIFRGRTDIPRVALTFDCGSDRGHAASILDTLAANGIRSSFGMTGMYAEANPDIVRRMVNEGHHLMNHTYTHPSFTGLSTPGTGVLGYWDRRAEIESCESLIASLTGASTKPYFRPAYGDYDTATLDLLGELGYGYNVMWTLDTLSWNGLTASQIVNRVAGNHGNGYIYLMHVGAASQDGPALPQVIATLRNYGYGFATVPNLLAGTGTTPVAKLVAGDTVRVTAGLYLRTGPGTGYGVLTTMPTGTACTVVSGPTLANGYTWYQLDTPYGRGWAAGEYLEKTGATPPPPPPPKFGAGDTVRVTAGLYLRTGVGFGAGVITTMPTGTVCTVVGGPQYANGLSWYQVDTPYGRGWAAGEYLEKTAVITPPPSGGLAAGEKVRVTAGLYLRVGPGTGYGVITTMPTGTTCTIVSGPNPANGLTWYQVDSPYGRGWCAGEYLAPVTATSGYPAGTRLRVTAGLYLRTGPGFSTGVIVTMPTGTLCTVVSGPQLANGLTWFQVDSPWGRGWAAGEYMAPV